MITMLDVNKIAKMFEVDRIIKIIRLAESHYSDNCDRRYEETKKLEYKTMKSTIKNFSDALEEIFRKCGE